MLIGILHGYYTWSFGNRNDAIGHKFYTFYYFFTDMHKTHKLALTDVTMYETYRRIFKGEANYETYTKAIKQYYDEAYKSVRYASRAMIEYELSRILIYLLIGAIFISFVSVSFLTGFFYIFGFAGYILLRSIYFISTSQTRGILCTHLIVEEAIDRYTAAIAEK
jgi:hypothetical protein